MQQSKIDSVVNKKIDGITNRGRGFTLDLCPEIKSQIQKIHAKIYDLSLILSSVDHEAAKSLIAGFNDVSHEMLTLATEAGSARVEVKESLPPVDEYVPPAELRNHTICDTSSFLEYADRYGSAGSSLILCGEERVVLVIDELVEKGDRERVDMPFKTSQEWDQWSQIIGQPMTHTELYKRLERLSHTLMDAQILESLRTMRARVQVSHESDIQDTGSSYGLIVKSDRGEEMKKFPKTFKACLPVLDQDAMQDPPLESTIEMRLEIGDPTETTRQYRFTLLCPEFERTLGRRINTVCVDIKSHLEGWTVLRGHHMTRPRTIGRPAASSHKDTRPNF